MREIVAIARNTFKEAIRNRILYVILIFALILIGFSGIVSELSIQSQMMIVKNLGFMSINFFALSIAVFVGVSLVYNELEKKSIYTIVSKPISRGHFIVGKYLGLLMTVYVTMLLMTFFFLIAIHFYSGAGQDPTKTGMAGLLGHSVLRALIDLVAWNQFEATRNVMKVVTITGLEMAIITSFSVLYSSFSTPTLSMFFTVLTFVAGRLNEDIIRFSEQIAKRAIQTATETMTAPEMPFSYWFARAAAYVVPNLGAFSDTVKQAIYQPQVELWWGTLVYGVLYTAGILCLSIMIFQRRNFK